MDCTIMSYILGVKPCVVKILDIYCYIRSLFGVRNMECMALIYSYGD